jgi:hypothetical protein
LRNFLVGLGVFFACHLVQGSDEQPDVCSLVRKSIQEQQEIYSPRSPTESEFMASMGKETGEDISKIEVKDPCAFVCGRFQCCYSNDHQHDCFSFARPWRCIQCRVSTEERGFGMVECLGSAIAFELFGVSLSLASLPVLCCLDKPHALLCVLSPFLSATVLNTLCIGYACAGSAILDYTDIIEQQDFRDSYRRGMVYAPGDRGSCTSLRRDCFNCFPIGKIG